MTVKAKFIYKGGPGSGNFGHAGRPGKVGGSGSGGVIRQDVLYPVIGYHVTSKSNIPKIEAKGLKGSKWPEDGDFENSNSDPFNLYDDGAVFAFPSLAEAKAESFNWDAGEGTVILEVRGEGLQFIHNAEGAQIVIQADTADYTIVD